MKTYINITEVEAFKVEGASLDYDGYIVLDGINDTARLSVVHQPVWMLDNLDNYIGGYAIPGRPYGRMTTWIDARHFAQSYTLKETTNGRPISTPAHHPERDDQGGSPSPAGDGR